MGTAKITMDRVEMLAEGNLASCLVYLALLFLTSQGYGRPNGKPYPSFVYPDKMISESSQVILESEGHKSGRNPIPLLEMEGFV